MSPREQIIEGVRKLLEEQYLESVSERDRHDYRELNELEKRKILKAFLRKLVSRSESDRWAKMLQDIL
jgi:hypothetical protein